MVVAKQRLDQMLVARGDFPSRERAQAAIMAGLVRVGGLVASKAGQQVTLDLAIEVTGAVHPYVSRGGLKLARALDVFEVDPAGAFALDAGASTGGFTDVLLKRGARHVVAVDVGYGQLAWELRQDPRVTVMERTNVRHLKPEQLAEGPSLIVADLSFISLAKVLPALAAALVPAGQAILLIKPQFEIGKGQAKGGVVRDPAAHLRVLEQVLAAGNDVGWMLAGVTHSPVRGPEGNIEFLGHWRPLVPGAELGPQVLRDAVASAHAELLTS